MSKWSGGTGGPWDITEMAVGGASDARTKGMTTAGENGTRRTAHKKTVQVRWKKRMSAPHAIAVLKTTFAKIAAKNSAGSASGKGRITSAKTASKNGRTVGIPRIASVAMGSIRKHTGPRYCDVCERKITRGTTMQSCTRCDWDVCSRCADSDCTTMRVTVTVISTADVLSRPATPAQ